MITADGWFDFAQRRHGPPSKVNGWSNPSLIYLPHSAVGDGISGWYSRLDNLADRASIHGWINKDGSFIQHYPIFAQCWGSGSGYPNNNGLAIEHQGGRVRPDGSFWPGVTDEPLTEPQIDTNVRILQDLAAFKGRDAVTYWRRPTSWTDLKATLYEHAECTRFGSLPTACPSGRIPWDEILRRLQVPIIEEDDEMYIVSKAKTTAADKFKSYLVRGKTFDHIPDAATFESLAKLDLELYEPDDRAWAFMTRGAAIND